MRIRNNTSNKEAGATLIVALFTALIIGAVLGSFLLITSSRTKLNLRSTAWNAAIPVLEAGVEEAMTHLHNDTNYTANGWTATNISGQMVFAKSRNLGDGSYFYTTIYGASSSGPTIYSAGFVPSPLGKGQYISRTVKVPTTNPPTVYTKAIAATGPISLGGSAIVDSFDSRLGAYDIVSNRGAQGSIATDCRANPAVSIGSANVYGTVTTGPGGTISIGNSGAIGDVAWNTSRKGIQGPAWTNNNMNVAFPSNEPPIGPFSMAPLSVVGGSNAIVLNTTGCYQMPSLNINSGLALVITTNATLWVTGDVNVQGTGLIYIAPGAKLKLYVGGRASIGSGALANTTGLASGFTYIGLSSNTSLSFSGGGSFAGTINAPQTDVSMSGNTEIYGAVICKTYSSNGGASVHYDVALATGGGLIATGWIEL